MTSFTQKKVFFANQDRHDLLENIATELGEVDYAEMLLVNEYKAHDLFGAVKVMTFTVTKYE